MAAYLSTIKNENVCEERLAGIKMEEEAECNTLEAKNRKNFNTASKNLGYLQYVFDSQW